MSSLVITIPQVNSMIARQLFQEFFKSKTGVTYTFCTTTEIYSVKCRIRLNNLNCGRLQNMIAMVTEFEEYYTPELGVEGICNILQ